MHVQVRSKRWTQGAPLSAVVSKNFPTEKVCKLQGGSYVKGDKATATSTVILLLLILQAATLLHASVGAFCQLLCWICVKLWLACMISTTSAFSFHYTYTVIERTKGAGERCRAPFRRT